MTKENAETLDIGPLDEIAATLSPEIEEITRKLGRQASLIATRGLTRKSQIAHLSIELDEVKDALQPLKVRKRTLKHGLSLIEACEEYDIGEYWQLQVNVKTALKAQHNELGELTHEEALVWLIASSDESKPINEAFGQALEHLDQIERLGEYQGTVLAIDQPFGTKDYKVCDKVSGPTSFGLAPFLGDNDPTPKEDWEKFAKLSYSDIYLKEFYEAHGDLKLVATFADTTGESAQVLVGGQRKLEKDNDNSLSRRVKWSSFYMCENLSDAEAEEAGAFIRRKVDGIVSFGSQEDRTILPDLMHCYKLITGITYIS